MDAMGFIDDNCLKIITEKLPENGKDSKKRMLLWDCSYFPAIEMLPLTHITISKW